MAKKKGLPPGLKKYLASKGKGKGKKANPYAQAYQKQGKGKMKPGFGGY